MTKAAFLLPLILLAGCTSTSRQAESPITWPTSQPDDGITAVILPSERPGHLGGPVPVVLQLRNDTDRDISVDMRPGRMYGVSLQPTGMRAVYRGKSPGNIAGNLFHVSLPAGATVNINLNASDEIRFRTRGKHTLRYSIPPTRFSLDSTTRPTVAPGKVLTTHHTGTVTVSVR